MFGPTTNRSRGTHPEGVQEEGPEDGPAIESTMPNVRRYKPSYSRSSPPFRGTGVDEQVSRQEEQEHEGPDHTRRRDDGAEDIVANARHHRPSLFEDCAQGANGRERLRLGPMHPPSEVSERNGIASRTYVRSLDEIVGGGIPDGFVVLLNGAPGR